MTGSMNNNSANPFAGKSTIPPDTSNTSEQASEQKKKPKKSHDQQVLEIVDTLQLYYQKSNDRCYCIISVNGVDQMMDINDHEFESWLHFEYRKRFDSLSKQFYMKPIQSYLYHKAKFEGTKVDTFNRVACINDQIWIDLMDQNNTVIYVSRNGWKPTNNPGIYFTRSSIQDTLPMPTRGGDLKDLFKIAPIPKEEDKVLVLSWLITAYFTDISGALLWFAGIEGSGKTLLATFIKSLIDPVNGKGFSLHDNPLEVAQVLDHNCIPFFDNVSQMSKKMSDLFCLAFSDGIVTKRKLHTDATDFILKPHKTALFTARQLPTIGSDLLDRSIIVNFNRIQAHNRKPEKEMLAEFKSKQPMLFGAVLDALVKVLNTYPSIKLSEYNRTADFQVRGAAAAESLGFSRKMFLDALKGNEQSVQKTIIESIPLVQAIDSMLNQCEFFWWEGYAKDLYPTLTQYIDHSSRLPNGPAALGKKIRDCIPLLERVGIQVDIPATNDKNGKRYKIFKIQGQTNLKPGNSAINQFLENVINSEIGIAETPPVETLQDQVPLVLENTEDSDIEGTNLEQPGQENPIMNDGVDTTSTPVKENGFQKTLINPDEFKKPIISYENEETEEDSEDSESNVSFKYDPKPSAGRYQP
jgi:hypothetical protein